MISGTQIHLWLQQPDLLLQEDALNLDELNQSYPYFSLGHLLAHYQRLGNTGNRDLQEIYGHNPVVYYYWKDTVSWPLIETEPLVVPDEPAMDAVSEKAADIDAMIEALGETEWSGDQQAANEDVLQFDAPPADYFAHQGIEVPHELPEKEVLESGAEILADQSLLVVMSFADWLQFLQHKTHSEQQEAEEQRALKALWQRQKMAEAIEEEGDEIPASVFEMAVNSISREEAVVSESMAIVYAKQGKIRASIDMYKKLSLKNPDKSVYFAQKIENLQKELTND